MTKKTRFTALFFGLLLSLPVMGCSSADNGKTVEQTTAETQSAETTAPETVDPSLVPPTFKDVKYNGYEFTFYQRLLNYGIYNCENLVIEEETGEILNDAIYARNRTVEELFDITVKEEITTSDTKTQLRTLVAAGDNAYDVVLYNEDMKLGADYVYDWYKIPGVNLDRKWYDQNYISDVSVKGQIYSMVSWLQLTPVDSTLGMLFNKNLAKDNGISSADIYQSVRDGKWTLDYFEEITKSVTRDLNGDGVMNDKDQYAFLGLEGMGRLGSGATYAYAAKDKDGKPYHLMEDKNNLEIVTNLIERAERMATAIYDPRTDTNTGGDGDKAVFRMFLAGQCFGYVHGFGSVQEFRDMEDDFGAVPPPKYDEEQENYSLHSSQKSSKPMYIMSIAENIERTGQIMEALSYYGYTDMRPLYYESMMYFKYLRDEESVEMLDQYMIPNFNYRPNYGSKTLSDVFENALKGTAELASSIASAKSAVEQEMADYFDIYTK